MSELENVRQAGAVARVASAALNLGRTIDLWSLVLVVIALLGLLTIVAATTFAPALTVKPHPLILIGLSMSFTAGVVQKYFALRVALDAQLFAFWATDWTAATPSETRVQTHLKMLDTALIACGLVAKESAAARDLPSRVGGALRLLRRQLYALAAQLAALALVAAVLLTKAI